MPQKYKFLIPEAMLQLATKFKVIASYFIINHIVALLSGSGSLSLNQIAQECLQELFADQNQVFTEENPLVIPNGFLNFGPFSRQ